MQVGNLVRITRASIGVPVGAVGLIIKVGKPRGDYVVQGHVTSEGMPMYPPEIFTVQFIGDQSSSIERRYLPRDMEVVSG
tara:strand:+ start:715 stop:954 length:240 start_codon:yes stop_codon:yes gene_type:complete